MAGREKVFLAQCEVMRVVRSLDFPQFVGLNVQFKFVLTGVPFDFGVVHRIYSIFFRVIYVACFCEVVWFPPFAVLVFNSEYFLGHKFTTSV
jgi:hypothetical protein